MSLSQGAMIVVIASLTAWPVVPVLAQTEAAPDNGEETTIAAAIGPERKTLTNKTLTFDTAQSTIPDTVGVEEILWDFGDGVRAIGEKVTHAYERPGTYEIRLVIKTDAGQAEDTTTVQVFERMIVVLADNTVSDEQLQISQQQAAAEGTLLLSLKARSGGPEALVEDDLTRQLLNVTEDVRRSHVIVGWTSGGVAVNVLSKFAQQIRQTEATALADIAFDDKGVVILTDTPFGVLAPTAQSVFDQLKPAYVLLTRTSALPVLYSTTSSDDARGSLLNSPVGYRLLGSFSSRAITDLTVTNFMSFGVNYLINRGVPINNIVLILMIPVIATILSFARQVVGVQAFGLITPAMTTLSFLVLGLPAGLIVFVVVLLSGTLTRLLLRRLRLLYLPRMALVLTSASLAILVMLGVGAATGNTAALSFSIFPILILAILAEEFIAVQFSRGARTAYRITAWTLLLAIICYYIVSWQLLRTFLLSYPEVVLLAIPINIVLGRFTGLRVTEYLRFRKLLASAAS